jgi:GTP-binding protein LepA
MPDLSQVRNFCIIAHIDHGKSTLADRMLELTGTVSHREMKEQLLDQMDLERERGITIKLQPVRMEYQGHILNLIDTPGHVDFTYEVSRSLAAVEGAILLVDASQGVQAQTLTVLYQALEQNLTVIPVINKIDLPHAEPEKRAQEVIKLIGCSPDDIIFASGKTGAGVEDVLKRVIETVPSPTGSVSDALRALVFDCVFDPYRGVVAYVRVVDGTLEEGDKLTLIQGRKETEGLEVGYFYPQRIKSPRLETGEIGYIITGMKEVGEIGIGDTFTSPGIAHPPALPGYRLVTPMVYASLYPTDSDQYRALRDAIGKLKLNDAALEYVTEHSPALGFGFRCGFLGMLHLEIVMERLKREYDVDVIATVPSVVNRVHTTSGQLIEVHNPGELPDITKIESMEEPWVKLEVVTPQSYVGAIMDLSQQRRGIFLNTQYLDDERVVLSYKIPLSEIIVNFYDRLKSMSAGYASMSYDLIGFEPADLVKVDIVVGGNPVEALSTIVPRLSAESFGRQLCLRLKELIPRQNFEIAIQATISGRIIARESISAFRKDVTAKLYGGDVTRKNKLLEKQKEGKKRMKRFGKVDIPGSVFVEVLKQK